MEALNTRFNQARARMETSGMDPGHIAGLYDRSYMRPAASAAGSFPPDIVSSAAASGIHPALLGSPEVPISLGMSPGPAIPHKQMSLDNHDDVSCLGCRKHIENTPETQNSLYPHHPKSPWTCPMFCTRHSIHISRRWALTATPRPLRTRPRPNSIRASRKTKRKQTNKQTNCVCDGVVIVRLPIADVAGVHSYTTAGGRRIRGAGRGGSGGEGTQLRLHGGRHKPLLLHMLHKLVNQARPRS